MMKLTAIAALLLLLQCSFTHAQQPQKDRKTTLEGVVVRAWTGEPLSRAQVTLIATSAAPSRASPPSVTTDSTGRFLFENVEAGSYRIAVARNGYARQEYGQRLFGGQGRILTVAAGQAIKDITFQLVPAGNLSGVVRDPSGEPLSGSQVQLLRVGYGQTGQRTFQVAGGDRTNDRGEYRVYWVTPGRYYVAVNAAASASSILSGAGSPNETLERAYPTTFYPGTIDVNQASSIDVLPGVEVNADILIPQHDLFHVRGRVVDPGTGQHPRAAVVSIVRRGPAAAPLSLSSTAPRYNLADGTFDLADVPPGPYWVRAIVSGDSASMRVPTNAAGRTVADFFADTLFLDRQTSQVAVDVGADIEGLVLALGSGASIRGHLSIDGSSLDTVPGFDRLQITLRPAISGMLMNPIRDQPMRRDGVFALENVLPGEYFVSVQPLPPEYYVKEAHLDQTDVLDRPLLITGSVSGTLTVALSGRAGQIDGVVLDDRKRAVPGVEAVLVPDGRRSRLDLYRTATTDPSGRFSIQGIAPGDYKVFAWEAIESFGYFDEDFVRQFEAMGVRARIIESSKMEVEVGIIPAPVTQR